MAVRNSNGLDVRTKNLIGQHFGRLTVLRFAEYRRNKAHWECRCDPPCDKIVIAHAHALTHGTTKSCGCYKADSGRRMFTTHRMSTTGTYRSWASMIQRCTNQQDANNYRKYGAKGIRVCERWLHSFEEFFADMGERPSKEHSLDRYPNRCGNYEPGNVRWATLIEQASNTKSAKAIEFNGITDTLSGWARRLSMDTSTLAERFERGWTLERALTTPSTLYHHRPPLAEHSSLPL